MDDVFDRQKWIRWWFSELRAFIKAVYNMMSCLWACWEVIRRPLWNQCGFNLLRGLFWKHLVSCLSTPRETCTTCTLLSHWTYLLTYYMDKVDFACKWKPNSCSFYAIIFPFDIIHFTSLLWISLKYCCKKPFRFLCPLLLFLSYWLVILATVVYGDYRSNLH